MKILKQSLASGMRLVLGTLALLLLLGVSAESRAYTLSDGNSSVQVDLGSSASVSAWNVSGVDYLNQQWFYYRIGSDGPEQPIQNISATPAVIQNTDNELQVTYANSDFSVQVYYKLTDSTGKSQLNLDFGVENLSANQLDMHFYEYSDFDLVGTPEGDASRFFKVSTRYTRVIQTDGALALTNQWTSGDTPITHVEAALYNTTLGKLVDANPTTLSDGLISGTGNATYAMEWDYVLAASGGALASSQTLGLTVPEPSTFALLIVGTFSLICLRRGRR
jgi:hypothetical protein